jgi:hypothetical protein
MGRCKVTEANLRTGNQMDEIAAMTEIAKALQPLDTESRRRVLQWAIDSFEASITSGNRRLLERRNSHDPGVQNDFSERFNDLAELYAATSPNNDREKALVVGYWFQKMNNDSDFDSGSINRELKHLGHGVGNITSALSSLMSRRPQMVIQTRKSGSSQQARKRYRITAEGAKQVEQMIRGSEQQ